MPDYAYEQQAHKDGFQIVCGIDEAGRGPWAGPVTAAAVIIDMEQISPELLKKLDDSKKLTAPRREQIYATLLSQVDYGIGTATVDEIDQLNILQATFLAMRRAVEALSADPDMALIDGNKCPGLPCAEQAIIKGDALSYSIAAASIVAKVSRDHVMQELDTRYPGYGWTRNAGYGTKQHSLALEALGVTPEHRKSYAPIRKILGL